MKADGRAQRKERGAGMGASRRAGRPGGGAGGGGGVSYIGWEPSCVLERGRG